MKKLLGIFLLIAVITAVDKHSGKTLKQDTTTGGTDTTNQGSTDSTEQESTDQEEEQQWTCEDGEQTIPLSYLCDGDSELGHDVNFSTDCDDDSDEGVERCCGQGHEHYLACCDNQFTCDDGQCINANFRCDGDDELGHDVGYGADCADGSDEGVDLCCGEDNDHYGCCDDSWECNDGQCISAAHQCDGDSELGHDVNFSTDCADGSDEGNDVCCGSGGHYKDCCDDDQWTCNNGDCIAENFLCDGDSALGHDVSFGPDCADGSDEGLDLCCGEDLNGSDYCDLCSCNTPREGLAESNGFSCANDGVSYWCGESEECYREDNFAQDSVRGDYCREPEVTCNCKTPREGTNDRNGLECTDGTDGWCGDNEECHNTRRFAKDAPRDAYCKRPDPECSCDTPGEGTAEFNGFHCSDTPDDQYWCAESEQCFTSNVWGRDAVRESHCA